MHVSGVSYYGLAMGVGPGADFLAHLDSRELNSTWPRDMYGEEAKPLFFHHSKNYTPWSS